MGGSSVSGGTAADDDQSNGHSRRLMSTAEAERPTMRGHDQWVVVIGTAKDFFVEGDEVWGPCFPSERVPAVSISPNGRGSQHPSVSIGVPRCASPTTSAGRGRSTTRVIAFPEGLEWTDRWTQKTQPAAVIQVCGSSSMLATARVRRRPSPPPSSSRPMAASPSSHARSLGSPAPHQWQPCGGGGLGLHTILIDPRQPEAASWPSPPEACTAAMTAARPGRHGNKGIAGAIGCDGGVRPVRARSTAMPAIPDVLLRPEPRRAHRSDDRATNGTTSPRAFPRTSGSRWWPTPGSRAPPT